MPLLHTILAVCCVLSLLPGQEPQLTFDVWSRKPGTDRRSEKAGPHNSFVGTRGYSQDIYRFRVGGTLPDGVKLKGMLHWSGRGDVPLAFRNWMSADAEDSGYLQGLRLSLTGAKAHEWVLSYKAHLGFIGDTKYVPDGLFLGQRGKHRFSLQGIRVKVVRRAAGKREIQLALQDCNPKVRRPIGFMVTWSNSSRARPDYRETDWTRPVPIADPNGFWSHEKVVAMTPPPQLFDGALAPGEHIHATGWLVDPMGQGGIKAADLPASLAKSERLALAKRLGTKSVLGGFTVIVSMNRDSRLSVQFGSVPGFGRVIPATALGVNANQSACLKMSDGLEVNLVVTNK